MAYFLELQVRGSAPVELELPSGRATLGAGSSSDLRVPESSGLLDRHLLLTTGDAGVTVTLASHAPGALVFRGQELRDALIPWGDEAYLANLRLGFVSRAGGPRRASALFLLIPLLVLSVGVASLSGSEPELDPTEDVEAPELGVPPTGCRENEPAPALERATEAERAAHAKMQRSAFVTREGVDALDLLAESSLCFRAAGLEGESRRVEAVLLKWSARLNEDYSAARLRLRLALADGRSEDALAAVRKIEALLSPRPPSPYTDWLAGVRRELERKKGGS
jgi:hypothetical protein